MLSHTGPPQPKLLAGSQPSPEGKITLRVLSSIQGRLKLGGQRHSNEGVHNDFMCVLHAAVGDTDSLGKQLFHSEAEHMCVLVYGGFSGDAVEGDLISIDPGVLPAAETMKLHPETWPAQQWHCEVTPALHGCPEPCTMAPLSLPGSRLLTVIAETCLFIYMVVIYTTCMIIMYYMFEFYVYM